MTQTPTTRPKTATAPQARRANSSEGIEPHPPKPKPETDEWDVPLENLPPASHKRDGALF